MIDFLKQISAACQEFPERAAIVDHDGARITDYRSLNTLSGKVAAYLKGRGISREDVVALLLPKGMEHIAVRIAVMKVGAAWVSLADSMGPERVRYAVRECRCAMEFTMDHWKEAMDFEALDSSQWVESAPHDLAFIIYTSGSTGAPKGAMQEYGVYERISAAMHRILDPYAPVQFGHIVPEVFVGGIYITIGLLQDGGTVHVISPELTCSPAALFGYFTTHGITATFGPPALANILQQQDGLPLRAVFVGGEIVSRVKSDRFDSMNIYGPSEFGHPTCLYQIDCAMENTPVGRPIPGTETILITDKGEETEGEGILCAELPFFRGYVSEPKQSPFVSLGGRRWFVSGDLARRDENGCYTILGRTDKMININGNRIDPSEVEAAMKKAFPITQATAKAFTVHGKPYLCAFYAGGEMPADAAGLSERLKAYLPAYMIPSYFVKLPELPVNSAGKLDYESLRLPEELSAPYAAPENQIEAELCRSMAKALELDGKALGVNDDFFALGGDSLAAMRMLMETELPGLDIADIYKGRTVRQMAKELARKQSSTELLQPTDVRLLPLLPFQMFYHRSSPAGTELVARSVAGELLFTPGTDPDRLARALDQAVKAHSALSTVIVTRSGKPAQEFRPELLAPVSPTRIPYDALDTEKAAFFAPFRADGHPLFRARLFVTERGCVLWLNAHHSICDGESLVVLIRDIIAAYKGTSVLPDDYRSFLLRQAEELAPETRRRERSEPEPATGGKDWIALPEPDMAADSEAGKAGRVQHKLKADRKAVSALAKRYGVSLSTLYCSLAALSLGFFEHADRVLITWTWNGRRDHESMRRVGLLLRDLILRLPLPDSQPVAAFVAETARQQEQGIIGDRSDEPARQAAEGISVVALCFVYQNYLKTLWNEPMLAAARPLVYAESDAEEPIEFIVWENPDHDIPELQYDISLYSEKRMRDFLELYSALLEQLCLHPESTVGRLRQCLMESGRSYKTEEGT